MARRLRLRITRSILSFNFNTFRRSKNSTPKSRTNTSAMDFPPFPAYQHPVPVVSSDNCCPRRRRRHRRRPISSGAEADAEADDLPLARGTPAYLWSMNERWHVVSCASSGRSSSSSPPRRKIDSKIFTKNPRRTRESDSSGDDSGWFSTDEEYEYENYDGFFDKERGDEEGKRENCFAVMKVSEDPRGDFRRSIAEMVVERGIYDVEGLERLLRCFLSLNDARHHRAIVCAFADVWQAIFPSVALAAAFPTIFYKC